MVSKTALGAALLAIGYGLVACAPPEATTTARSSKHKSSKGANDANDDSGDDDDSTPRNTETPRDSATVPNAAAVQSAAPQIAVSFLGSLGQKFGTLPISRVCSDRGADFSNATFIDATGMQLVGTQTGEVLVDIQGAQFQTIKQQVLATGDFYIPIDASKLSNQPYEYAIIATGDSRFGSPAACGHSLDPGSDPANRDIEEFPTGSILIFGGKFGGTGCGTVGYLTAYYDAASGKVIAKPTSQLLLAADDEGKGDFPVNNYNPACDGHDSPLVLDLGGKGVHLGTPVAGIFDVDGDGRLDESPWVVSDDTPFLVRDANGNGSVDGVAELFGNRTRSSNGSMDSVNGFDALAKWDKNHDGVIDVQDDVWSTLRLWFDKNHDGVTDPGELVTLQDRGVKSIALGYIDVKEKLSAGGHVQGAIRQRGGVSMDDGRVVDIVDVWFDRKL